MLEAILAILSLLNAMSPTVLSLGIIGGCIWIIWLLTAKKGPMRLLSDNHLSGLPEMADTLVRIEEHLAKNEETQLQLLAIASRIEGMLRR